MSKSPSKPKLKQRILDLPWDGEKTSAEIKKAIPAKVASIDKCISRMVADGELVRVIKGTFRLPDSELTQEGQENVPAVPKNQRGELENTETINTLLNLYDKLLDRVALSIEDEDWDGIVEKIETIKSLRWLGATVDQLMKRWYLVHRGYDANTRQAQEDAKQKTVEREKEAHANAPPEDQVVVIREYDETMREVLAKLPGKDLKKRTV
ncbi:hypothetical protein C6502_12770 [Candidatus Poribacteria bacterium]|nr:MAG: hypothetical protein C6502_12770 [Candidatus Poribacteria bacterium]